MAEIQLTQGKVALVDDADVPLVMGHKWYAVRHATGIWYAQSGRARSSKLMHRLILPDAPRIDHWDRDGLNNQRGNLRPCTASQNLANSRHQVGGTSHYKGVCWVTRERRWRAQLKSNYRTVCLGYFTDEIAAARAYNAGALATWGEFACPNVIEE